MAQTCRHGVVSTTGGCGQCIEESIAAMMKPKPLLEYSQIATIELTGYHLANLRALLEWAAFANTGDWYHELLHMLPLTSAKPNADLADLDARAARQLNQGEATHNARGAMAPPGRAWMLGLSVEKIREVGEVIEAAVAAERERCAKICETYARTVVNSRGVESEVAAGCAAAIAVHIRASSESGTGRKPT